LAFVSATTIGRDIVWRIKGRRNDASENRYTRWGLVAAALLSIGLALWIPSVIKLWYTIGTVIIPGLLIPLVTSYFDDWKAPARYTFVSMLLGWLTSTIWLMIGWTQQIGADEFYPFGIEPMYPGLLVSAGIWGIGRLVHARRIVPRSHGDTEERISDSRR
jgi:SSS family solute:Na+ symporter